MINTIHELLLTLPSLFEAYKLGGTFKTTEMRARVQKGLRDLNPTRPDHYLEPYVKEVFEEKGQQLNLPVLLINAFQALSEILEFRNGTLYVTSNQFAHWQNHITAMPPLPLLAYAYFRHYGPERARSELIQRRPFRDCLLPMPYHPMLYSLLREHPPNDLHVHLNGTTQADFIWQQALAFPIKNFKEFKITRNREAVRQQYLQSGDTHDEVSLLYLLFTARALRDKVSQNAADTTGPIHIAPFLQSQFRSHVPQRSYRYHPNQCGASYSLHAHENEMLWWLERFQELKYGTGDAVSIHAYLLMACRFYRMLVQQRTQKGFDQFQKITLNELRSHTERDFEARFRQLGGKGQLAYLEGRFAPKRTARDMIKQLRTIIEGYKKFSEPVGPVAPKMQLRLVAHFIKEKEDIECDRLCRHFKLRRRLHRQARILVQLRTQNERFRDYLTGADAAANELHTPPEVFAPIFRYMRQAGWSDFTFHVGEDYLHLVSGIRAVWEAVRYLGLRDGNRIGHATAIGINPTHWLQQCSPTMLISRGECLDNLIFMLHLHIQKKIELPYSYVIKIHQYWREIYPPTNEAVTPHLELMLKVWENRGWDPLLYMQEPEFTLERWLNKEAKELEKRRSKDELLFQHLKDYHRKDNRERAAKLIEVDTNLFPEEMLRLAQDATIEYLNKRMVAVESMPTSNVRIAPYSDYKDHHIFRWLNMPDEGRPCPTVVLASDDPGIFANHLPGEYAHLLETLVGEKKLSHKQAMVLLKQLNENGKDFLFGQDRRS